jgi:hypothetical protein
MPLQTNSHISSAFSSHGKKKIIVYLTCLALSFFLWFLNSLDKKYTERILVPVKYVNIPNNKQFSRPLPRELEMTVDASGFTILQYKIGLVFSPLLLDVGQLTNNYLDSKYVSRYEVSTMNHKESIARQISNDLQIINIYPDSIYFDVSPMSDRKVRVKPRVKLFFYKEFTSKQPPFTSPDSVWIHGPQNVLDTLKSISTKEYEFNEISHNLLREVKLDLPSGLSTKVKKVLLNVPVEQYTEAAFEIPVNILNLPDSITIKLFPAKIKVSCRVGLSEYANISKNSFKAYISFNPGLLSLSKLPVKLGHYPEAVLSAEYYPKEVDYVIEYKK